MRQKNFTNNVNIFVVDAEEGETSHRRGPFSKTRQGQSRRNERARVRALKAGF